MGMVMMVNVYRRVFPCVESFMTESEATGPGGLSNNVDFQGMQNLHTLLIRNIPKNITKEAIWKTIAHLRLGAIRNIVVNACAADTNHTTAIVYYENWNMPETAFIRRMLESNLTLDILYDIESPPWVMSQYDDTLTFASPPMLPNGVKHRKIKKDTQCYAPTEASHERTYVIEETHKTHTKKQNHTQL